MTKLNPRSNWRTIKADGHTARVTREGAAYYLRIGRSLGYKFIKIEGGWMADDSAYLSKQTYGFQKGAQDCWGGENYGQNPEEWQRGWRWANQRRTRY